MHLLTDMVPRFWQWIKPVDERLLIWVNQGLGNPVLDTLLPFVRETLFWYPLYLFLLLFAVSNFRAKGWWWVLGVILTASLADLLSSQVIKEQIWRLRPCRDPEVAVQLRFFINYCPGSSSFTSSHATSHFAQALFFIYTLRHLTRWAYLFLVWAGAIAFSQVYVGVHYPFDVIMGALIGSALGFLMAKMYHKHSGMLSLVN